MEEKQDEFFNTKLVLINIGVYQFYESLVGQEVEVIQIDWSPPAGGDQEMLDLLDDLL